MSRRSLLAAALLASLPRELRTDPADTCTTARPNRAGRTHEGAEQVGAKTTRTGDRVELHRCHDCGAEWEV